MKSQKDEFQRVSRKEVRMTGRELFEKDNTLAKSDVGLLADTDMVVDVDAYEKEDRNEEQEEVNAVLAGFSDDD